ncbi:uncharacterized protein E6C27_scaffold46G004140 [Cucumis melo var. makuwa]|uniref:Uncharacterized protein n=1 Tax=Cucumis melo var. makuwa TaxID=1194695 RepID=A0A5A7TP52_CUCMM|nr:uncharacterized protein E6C27_scaffold46G004140 [Cucumis melo var. makuwa]
MLGQRPLPFLMKVCFEVCLEEDRTNAIGALNTLVTDFAAFSTWSLTHDNHKKSRKRVLVCAIARTPQSFVPISVDGKNLWILDLGATDHLIGSSVYFISYTPCAEHDLGEDDRHCSVSQSKVLPLYQILMDSSCGSSASSYSLDQNFFNIFVFFLTKVDNWANYDIPLQVSVS